MAKKFENMTVSQKRVAVAKDVLKWLNSSRKVKPTEGTFVSNDYGGRPQRMIDALSGTCRVCALGSLGVCYMLRTEPKCNELRGWYSYLKGEMVALFGESNLLAIETAFEGDESLTGGFFPDSVDLLEKSKAIYDRFTKPRRRLRYIMNNIIANKGEFVPA